MVAKAESQLRRLDGLVVAVLGAVVLFSVRDALAPSSLWFDDAWQALVVKARSIDEVLTMSSTTPGFGVVLIGWLRLVGTYGIGPQIPALLGGMALPGAVFLVARRFGIGLGPAILSGTLLAASPQVLVYSTRVKPYTLNALLALAVVSLAWRIVITGGSGRRWAVLVGVAVVSTAMSGQVGLMAAGVIAATALVARRRGSRQRLLSLMSLTFFAAWGAAWWLLVLSPATNPALRGYWHRYFINAEAEGSMLASTVARTWGFIGGIGSLPSGLLVAAAAIAGIALLAKRELNILLLFSSPFLVALAAAAVEAAPFGGGARHGRIDVYLYPAFALLVAVGFDKIRPTRLSMAVAAVLSVVAIGHLLTAPRVVYPQEDLRPLVAIAETHEPDGPAVVYGWAKWSFALYTGRPIAVEPSQQDPEGFVVSYPDGTVLVTPIASPTEGVGEFAARTDHVWFLASHFREEWPVERDQIRGEFAAAGLVSSQRWEAAGAMGESWERPASSALRGSMAASQDVGEAPLQPGAG